MRHSQTHNSGNTHNTNNTRYHNPYTNATHNTGNTHLHDDLDSRVPSLPRLAALTHGLKERQQCGDAQRRRHHGKRTRRRVTHVLIQVVDVRPHCRNHRRKPRRFRQVADNLPTWSSHDRTRRGGAHSRFECRTSIRSTMGNAPPRGRDTFPSRAIDCRLPNRPSFFSAKNCLKKVSS